MCTKQAVAYLSHFPFGEHECVCKLTPYQKPEPQRFVSKTHSPSLSLFVLLSLSYCQSLHWDILSSLLFNNFTLY